MVFEDCSLCLKMFRGRRVFVFTSVVDLCEAFDDPLHWCGFWRSTTDLVNIPEVLCDLLEFRKGAEDPLHTLLNLVGPLKTHCRC